jgi:F0F1-type ATP synthase alpha subunit
MDVPSQVIVFWAVTNGYFDKTPISEIQGIEERLISALNSDKKLKKILEEKKAIDETVTKEFEKLVKSVVGK